MLNIPEETTTAGSVKVCDAGFVQSKEWMLYKIRADHYPFNIATEFMVDAFDPLVMQKVIDLLVERHEVLRTTLKVIDGRLRQVIHAPDRFPVHYGYFNLGPLSEDEKKDWIIGKMKILSNTPFNFEFGPLFRAAVFALDPTRFSIHFVFHHVVSDEHSMKLFVHELNEIFKMVSGHPGYLLEGDVVQYSRHSLFENELLETYKGDPYRKFWEHTLRNGIPDLEIIGKDKLDKRHIEYLKKTGEVMTRIDQLTYSDRRLLGSVIRRYEVDVAGQLQFAYSTPLFERILKYKTESRNGLLSLFIGSLLLALYKLSGQKEYAFEIPGTSRMKREFRKTMGWLTTGAPCFFHVDEDMSAANLLDHIDEQLYLLAKHCVYPAEAGGYKASPPTGGRMPVFLTLSYLDEVSSEQRSGIIFNQPEGYATYQDIGFFFNFFNNSASLQILYTSSLFDAELVETIVNRHLIDLEYLLDR